MPYSLLVNSSITLARRHILLRLCTCLMGCDCISVLSSLVPSGVALTLRSLGIHAIERANDDTCVCLTIRGSQTANTRILRRFLPHSVSAGALGALAAATIAVEAEEAVIHALAGQALTVRIFRAPVGSIATLIM